MNDATQTLSAAVAADDSSLSLLDVAVPLAQHWKLILFGALVAGLGALGSTYAIAPTYTARTTFLPPQQQSSSAATALSASLGGALSALGGVRTPGDQYVALLQSAAIQDRLIDQFSLMAVYDTTYRVDARTVLEHHVRILLGRRDGIITIEVDDTVPKRSADIANRYIEELRLLTSRLALTEAQQRRAFFQTQLQDTRNKLTDAQRALEASGFNAGALRTEPRAAAESYGSLKAELTAGEVRLQVLRQSLTDTAPEVLQLLSRQAAVRDQLARLEASDAKPESGTDYVGRYREFKYQETLFDLISRQYELAKVDESRDGTLMQVIDPAAIPERKSRPSRSMTAIVWTVAAGLGLMAFVVARYFWRVATLNSVTAEKAARVRRALRGRE